MNQHDDAGEINTVNSNLIRFNQKQVKEAKAARKLQHVGGLSLTSLLRMIDSGSLINSPVTREAVHNTIKMWGPSVPSMKGKTTRSSPDSVDINVEHITIIPPYILENHANIVICVDVMKVNKVPFLVTIGAVVKFGSASELRNMKTSTIAAALIVVLEIYHNRGFRIICIACDNAFDPLIQNH